ncbi:MAG: hypothetical protein IT385_02150 [Deltaproteobacteria bacterium]|nr:hypothetical protein [Deltaproteobacteria bacterium]
MLVLTGCPTAPSRDDGGSTTVGADDAPAITAAPPTSADADAPEATPRARSEPPPGPPVPDGVRVFRRDVVSLSLSGDGRFLVGGDLGGKALLWDLERGVFVWGDDTPVGNRIRPVVFPERGVRWLAGAFDEPDLPWRLYDAARAELVVGWGQAGATAVDAAFDRQASRVVVASGKPDLIEVYMIDEAATPPARIWQRATRARVVALDASGERVAWSEGQRVEVRALADDSLVLEITEDAPTSRIVFDGDALVGAQGAVVVRWSTSGAPRVATALADQRLPIRELKHLPRGLVALTRAEEQGLVIWDAARGEPVAEVSMGCQCEVHALAANGCMAACGCATLAEVRWTRLSGPAFPQCP